MNPFEGVFMPVSHVTLDDGGVRIRSFAAIGRYVPFTTIRDARVAFRLFGTALLHLVHDDGVTTASVPHDDALFLQGEIFPHVGARTTQVATSAPARGVSPLGSWLADVATWANVQSGYRAAAFDRAAATATFEDPNAPAELRAAMAHALLATGEELALTTIARAFVSHALPPIVVVAARLGRGGAALVPDAMFDEAITYLPTRDAQDAEGAARSPVTHENESHVHEVIERVRAAAVAEAAARFSLEAHRATPKKRHHASALGGYASSQGVTRFK